MQLAGQALSQARFAGTANANDEYSLHFLKYIKPERTRTYAADEKTTKISVNSAWCTIVDIKITLPGEPEEVIKDIQELLDAVS
jgi:hypothetical protein